MLNSTNIKKILFICIISHTYVFKLACNELYLDLMKKILINSIYKDQDSGVATSIQKKYDVAIREIGNDWPLVAHTMIGLHALNNIQFCMEDILKNNIPGDFIETGVWRGGATIFMRAVLKAHNVTDRKVYVADSFQGLPPSNPKKYPADAGYNFNKYDALKISEKQVKLNFAAYELLDEQVVFLKGWFKDTLPNAPIEKLAILRLDGDLYESTMDALKNLYHKVSIGGYIIVDDYMIPCCRKAIEDFRTQNKITDKILYIDTLGRVYWQKTK